MKLNQEHKNLNKQKRVLSVFLGIVLVGVLIYAFYLFDDKQELHNEHKSVTVDLPIDATDPKELWFSKLNSQNQVLEQRLKYIEDMMLEDKRQFERKRMENADLSKQIETLKESLNKLKKERTEGLVVSSHQNVQTQQANIQSFMSQSDEKKELKEVVASQKNEKVKHVDNSIPAGTSVKAVLVSSVDVPCGIYSQNDPQPVKLQILDDSRLPFNVRVKLKGSIIIGSAYGDISNERVYIRAERMTQTKPNGEYVETEVAAYASGEDGKYGVRGCVVDKSGKMIKNATISGFFSGVNQVLQANRESLNIYNNPEQDNVVSAGNVLRSGGISGANNAFDRLTDYYIKQADRISPVIQVTAGRTIDITFTHGCDIGDLHTKDKVCEVRNQSRTKSRELKWVN